jgi:nicotinamidase-related amidase
MTRPLPILYPQATALVLIDLQRGIVARPCEPRSGAEVVHNAVRLAQTARESGALVVLWSTSPFQRISPTRSARTWTSAPPSLPLLDGMSWWTSSGRWETS